MHDVHVYGVLMGDVLCGDGAHNAHVVDNPLRLTRRAIKQLTEVGVGVTGNFVLHKISSCLHDCLKQFLYLTGLFLTASCRSKKFSVEIATKCITTCYRRRWRR